MGRGPGIRPVRETPVQTVSDQNPHEARSVPSTVLNPVSTPVSRIVCPRPVVDPGPTVDSPGTVSLNTNSQTPVSSFHRSRTAQSCLPRDVSHRRRRVGVRPQSPVPSYKTSL